MDTEPIVKVEQQQQHQTYWQRWYVLAVYGLLITFQGSLWNTWGPLHDNMKLAFNWDTVTFGLLPFWGPFCYVLSFFPWTALMNRHGLRLSLLLSAGLVFAAAAVKTPAPLVGDDAFRILCHVCGFINGVAAPALFTTPPMVAAVWFPRSERVTATAVGGSCQSLAIAASFLIGPLFVPEISGSNSNSSSSSSNSSSHTAQVQELRSQVYVLNYAQAGTAAVIFLSVLLYFPTKPPTPPALSCEVPRSSLMHGLRSLPGNTWLVVVAYGLPLGVSAGFSAVFDVNVSSFGIGQTQAGWMGFVAVMAGTALSLVAASAIDRLPHLPMKWVNVVFLSVAAVCYAWFTAALCGLLPASTAAVYTANIIANVALYCSLPIFYELACEAAFPIAEEVPAMLITSVNCLFASIFLAILFAPSVGTRWMNFVMTGACVAAAPMLAFFTERHHRRAVDLSDNVNAADAAEPVQ